MIILTIIAFIVIFSVLILIHEWGHFTAARQAGVKVEEFGIGIPPRAKKLFKDKKGTLYSLNWIPFGGFVRLFGEDSSDPKVLKDSKSFASKTLWQRTRIILAGVFMNFVLAWVLITIGFSIGMKPFLVTEDDFNKAMEAGLLETNPVVYVHEVESGSSAEEAGILSGDILLSLNQKELHSVEDLTEGLGSGISYPLTLEREDESLTVTIHPNEEGKIGVVISQQELIEDIHPLQYPIYKAPYYALHEVVRLSALTVDMLGNVVVSLVAKFAIPEGVAGPVGIARMTHTFVQQGIMALIQFTALISISLGVINVMPFPALDGGRFLFILFEVITRKKPSPKWESIIHTIGFVLLMALIVVITWNDIVQFF